MKHIIPIGCALCLSLLVGCGEDTLEVEAIAPSTPEPVVVSTPTPTATPEPEPTEEPYDGVLNPLTGEPLTEGHEDWRPVAVVLNNLYSAMPQLGQSQADIIYEIPVEGGITRMVAIYQDTTGVDTIGTIRSSRTAMLEIALGHDAIYIHAGGSEEAYSLASAWNVTALDGVNGPYMSNSEGVNLMWRDPTRLLSYSSEHTVVTTGATIISELESYNIRRNVEDDFSYEMNFSTDASLKNGDTAEHIAVYYSTYKTGRFTYDAETNLYGISQYSIDYIDGNDGSQVTVSNVLVVYAQCSETNDSLGHVDVDISGTGDGYFAYGGEYIPITWSKSYPDGQFYYYDLEGNPITFGQGSTYVNIVDIGTSVTFE